MDERRVIALADDIAELGISPAAAIEHAERVFAGIEWELVEIAGTADEPVVVFERQTS